MSDNKPEGFHEGIQRMSEEWKAVHLRPKVEALKTLDISDVLAIASEPIPDVRELSEDGLKIALARAELQRRGIPFTPPKDGSTA